MALTKIVDGKEVVCSQEEEAAILAEWAEADAKAAAVAYVSPRLTAYGTVGDQLDYIFHNGLPAWLTWIQAIKDKYPKPGK